MDTTISFKNPNFLSIQLNAENVLSYFCDVNNPFYIRGSDNETLRMQNINLARNDILEKMTGIQFQVVNANPPLFVIRKHQRNGIAEVTPLCYYYILDGTIYQAPDIYSVVQSRMACALKSLQNAIDGTLDILHFNVADGHRWEFKNRPAKLSTEDDSDEEDEGRTSVNVHKSYNRLEKRNNPLQERATAYQRCNVDALLKLLIQKFPIKTDTELRQQQLQQKPQLASLAKPKNSQKQSNLPS